ncbi:MAG: caspase family protein [Desulfobacterales bacterium]|nr:caspase family protein [Desulfobacterales bacterium]
MVVWLAIAIPAMGGLAHGEDRALLVGVGRYAQLDARLSGVDLDIRMMTEFAQLLGFENDAIKVLAHEAASTRQVAAAIENWLIQGVGPDDRILFYFSGHGSQIPDTSQDENDAFDEVLLMYDAAIVQQARRTTLTGVLVDDAFSALLARMHSRNIFVILDACHSGSATRSLHLNPRSFAVNDAQVKSFSYSADIEAAGGGGRFDVMAPSNPGAPDDNYVVLTACRDDEKTVATAQGSIFTLGLRQVVRSAAMAGDRITPEALKRLTTQFIRAQIRSDTVRFHPQIAGNADLRKRPLQLVSLGEGSGFVRQEIDTLVNKSNETIWIELNKHCFEIGDPLAISLWIPEAGHLNIISVDSDDQGTVLFPNRYHPRSNVKRGRISIPGGHKNYALTAEGKTGPHRITAFLTRSPLNAYANGFRTPADVLARLSPHASRSLALRQQQEGLAAGSATTHIRREGHCR